MLVHRAAIALLFIASAVCVAQDEGFLGDWQRRASQRICRVRVGNEDKMSARTLEDLDILRLPARLENNLSPSDLC